MAPDIIRNGMSLKYDGPNHENKTKQKNPFQAG